MGPYGSQTEKTRESGMPADSSSPCLGLRAVGGRDTRRAQFTLVTFPSARLEILTWVPSFSVLHFLAAGPSSWLERKETGKISPLKQNKNTIHQIFYVKSVKLFSNLKKTNITFRQSIQIAGLSSQSWGPDRRPWSSVGFVSQWYRRQQPLLHHGVHEKDVMASTGNGVGH